MLCKADHHRLLENSLHIHPFHHQHMRVCANEMQFEASPLFKIKFHHPLPARHEHVLGKQKKGLDFSQSFHEFPPYVHRAIQATT